MHIFFTFLNTLQYLYENMFFYKATIITYFNICPMNILIDIKQGEYTWGQRRKQISV